MSHSEPGPDLDDYGDLTGDQVARLGVSNAAVASVERLLAIVSTVDDHRRGPTGLTEAAYGVLQSVNAIVARAIMTDKLRGAGDDELAGVFNTDEFTFVRRFGHLDKSHLADDPDGMWEMLRPSCPHEIHDSCPDTPAAAAAYLDEWMRRHYDPREVVPPPARPVSAGL